MNPEVVDVVVIGGGIAGVSVAATLAETLKVVVLERESHPGLHSTGRSAALFSEIYGGETVRALSRGSREFLYSPPPGFAESTLVRPRDTLHIATAEQEERLDEFANLPDVAPAIRRIDGAAAYALCPILREDQVVAGALETASADLDVNGLHQGWLRQLRARGGRLLVNAEVNTLQHTGGTWRLETPDSIIHADVVINAAGAWADVLARRAGVREIGLEPRRRTALIVDVPAVLHVDSWPMVIDIDEQFYFKPDAGALLLSPADETLSEPCDAWPDDWDVAIAVDRVQKRDHPGGRPGASELGGIAQLRSRSHAGGGLCARRAGILLARRPGRLRHSNSTSDGDAGRGAGAADGRTPATRELRAGRQKPAPGALAHP